MRVTVFGLGVLVRGTVVVIDPYFQSKYKYYYKYYGGVVRLSAGSCGEELREISSVIAQNQPTRSDGTQGRYFDVEKKFTYYNDI